MSAESMEWLNNNTLIGFTDKRGYFWHYNEALQNGELSNHYPAAIPMADVLNRLFYWDAVEADISYWVNDECFTPDDRKAIAHGETGKLFYVGSDRYAIHQYREWLLEKPMALLDASGGQLEIGSAGLLQEGARAWVQLETPDGVSIGGDKLVPFVLATTSHNGTGATEYKRGFSRVGCDNTLAVFMSSTQPSVRVKHCKGNDLRLGEAREILEIAFKELESERDEIAKMIDTKITDDQFRKLVTVAVPNKSETKNAITRAEGKRAGLINLWETSPMIVDIKNTAWGALQTFNTYGQHIGNTKTSYQPAEKIKMDFLKGTIATDDRNIYETMIGLELITA